MKVNTSVLFVFLFVINISITSFGQVIDPISRPRVYKHDYARLKRENVPIFDSENLNRNLFLYSDRGNLIVFYHLVDSINFNEYFRIQNKDVLSKYLKECEYFDPTKELKEYDNIWRTNLLSSLPSLRFYLDTSLIQFEKYNPQNQKTKILAFRIPEKMVLPFKIGNDTSINTGNDTIIWMASSLRDEGFQEFDTLLFLTSKLRFKTNSLFYIDIKKRLKFNSDVQFSIFQQLFPDDTINFGFNFQFPTENYLTPFYFKKYEVTNDEYNEFVIYVRDSIAHYLLGKKGKPESVGEHFLKGKDGNFIYRITEKGDSIPLINWNEIIDWENVEVLEILEFPNDSLFISEIERYYRIKQIDTRRLRYYCENGSIVQVYPDTTAWQNIIGFRFNDPEFEQDYFWHPAFGNYPVVGISYEQALAFLDYKTNKLQKELDKKGIPYKVIYELPTEAEWEMACLRTNALGGKVKSYSKQNIDEFADFDFQTDLIVKKDSLETLLKKRLYNDYHSNNFPLSAFVTNEKSISYSKLKDAKSDFQTSSGISGLEGNVSEWMNESYDNWQPVYNHYIQYLMNQNDSSNEILIKQLEYFNSKNDKHGKLVRGANFYDYRISEQYGRKVQNLHSKLFVNPETQACTIGFRYVVKFEPK